MCLYFSEMSELLFECYHIPKVAYGVDALFSLMNNHPKHGKLKLYRRRWSHSIRKEILEHLQTTARSPCTFAA